MDFAESGFFLTDFALKTSSGTALTPTVQSKCGNNINQLYVLLFDD